jgi:ubiquinone/menaquinone biosynthesis C-methylase UbiE
MTASNTAPPAGGFAHPKRNMYALGVRAGTVIVDFGAGSGAYVLGIAEHLNGMSHVYAVDVQQDLLRRIKNEAHRRDLKNVETIWGDLERPNGSKIADKHADYVLISNLLFQVEHKSAVLAEARRILKNNGTLAIIDWSESPPAGARRLGPIKKDIVTKEKAIALAVKEGFELQNEFEAGAHHYGLLFSPKVGDN